MPRHHRRHRRGSARPTVGLPPGTIEVAADAPDLRLHLIQFDADRFVEREIIELDTLAAALEEGGVAWLDVVGHGDAERMKHLGDILGLHPLALEDIVHLDQRTKIEAYGDDLLLFFRRVESGDDGGSVSLFSEQLTLLFRAGLVVTFQEQVGNDFEPVRRRARTENSRIRSRGADYLAYALLDATIDRYGVLLDGYRSTFEELEEEVLQQPDVIDLKRLHGLRRDLIRLGRFAAPMRDLLAHLLREAESGERIGAQNLLFLRDCLDHAIRVAERCDVYRDLSGGLVELHLSMLGHRTNEVTKVLTLVATIFIPLSFLVGLYGMNFDRASPWNMPELGYRFGYPILVVFMVSLVSFLVWLFKKRGWL